MSDDSTPAPECDYSPEGVDRSLVRWMISLTPAERLDALEQSVNDLLILRERNGRS